MSDVSESTKAIYTAKLNKLKVQGCPKFNDVDDVMQLLVGQNYAHETLKSYISAIKYAIRKGKYKDKDGLINKYSVYQNDLIKKIRKHNYSGIMSDREKKNFTIWPEIVKFVQNFEPKYSLDHLIVSLYTYIPPRRREYYNMIVSFNKPESYDKRLNYVIVPEDDNAFFVFNEYKTKSTYGEQIIELPSALDNIVRMYIILNRIIEGDKLIPVKTPTNMTKRVQHAFAKGFDKSISINILRHSYVTHYMNTCQQLTAGIIKETSWKMAHSVEESTMYLRIVK